MKKAHGSNFIDKDLYEANLPLFQAGESAKLKLADDDGSLTRSERVDLRRAVRKGDDAFAIIYSRVEWLINRVVRDEMDKPRAFHVILEEEDLKQAALEGLYKMLMKADLNKMDSAMNYLMNWIKTTVERAASKNESEFGMSPSKLRIFRKIAAVRTKMKADLGREPSDDEVLEYFHSGQADWKSMYGRKGSNKTAFKENAKMTLKDVTEQSDFNTGYPMHTPVTDAVVIDREVSDNGGISSLLEPDSKQFWMEYMNYLDIVPEQRLQIVNGLGLYDTDAIGRLSKNEKSKQSAVINDFKNLIATESGGLREFAIKYDHDHGHGSWSAFINMPELSQERPVFLALRLIDRSGK